MIRLQAGAILLHTPDGGLEFLDLDGLHQVLWECCQAVGLNDAEMPDDILGVVASFADQQNQLTAGEIDALVVQILNDSGLSDLAREFAWRRHVDLEGLPANDTLVPTAQTVSRILDQDPFFVSKPIAQISAMVAAQIDKLGFRECTAEFVSLLARHSWHHIQARPQSQHRDYWVIHRSEFQRLLTPAVIAAQTAGQLRFHSVSKLFPVIRVQLALFEIARAAGPALLPELQFLPAVRALCEVTRNGVQILQKELLHRLKEDSPPRPAQIQLVGLARVVKRYLAGDPREHQLLRNAFQPMLDDIFDPARIAWQCES